MNEPRLRFKRFKDEWYIDKLSSTCTFINGRAYRQKELLNHGKYKVIRVGNFYTDKDLYYSNLELNDNKYIYNGDLIYTWSATFGPHIWNGEKSIYHYHIWKIVLNNKIKKEFLLQLLKLDISKIKTNGGTMPHITKNNMENKKIIIPKSLNEQQKIGSFFEKLDQLIQLQYDKLEHLKETKKGYLQKMFPKNTSIPYLRYKKSNDEWEKSTLGQLGKTFTGLSGKNKDDFGHGSARYITYLNVYNNPVTNNNLEKIEIDNKQNQVKYGDIFFTTSSETPYEVGLSSVWMYNYKNIYLNSFCFGYRLNKKMNLEYMAYALRSDFMRKKINILAQGISRFNMSKNALMKINFQYPKLDEQQKIGQLFSNIDQQITLQQQKIDNLQQQKKAYLQKMFI